MSLTSLEVTVDQSRAGWLLRAGREAATLLDAQSRPQMAAALRAEFARRTELPSLQRFVRLRLLPGSAAPLPRTGLATQWGPLDDGGATEGKVPLEPAIDWLREDSAVRLGWTLVLGDVLLTHVQESPGEPGQITARQPLPDPRGGLVGWEVLWHMEATHPWLGALGDRDRVALLQRHEGNKGILQQVATRTKETLWAREVELGAPGRRPRMLSAEGVLAIYLPDSGRVAAWNEESGRELWTRHAPEDAHSALVQVVGQNLCLMTQEGTLRAVNLRTGGTRWQFENNGYRPGYSWAGGHQGAEALYLWQAHGRLTRYALDAGTFRTIEHGLSGAPRALASQSGVTYVEHDDRLHALLLYPEVQTLWSRPIAPPRQSALLNIVGDTLLRSDGKTLSAYRLEDGHPLWEGQRLPHSPGFLWGLPDGVLLSGASGALGLIRPKGA